MVEFAIVFPIFIFALIAVIQLHLIFQARAGLHEASFAAARAYAMTGNLSSAQTDAETTWANTVRGSSAIAVTVTTDDSTPLGTLCTATVTTNLPLFGIPYIKALFGHEPNSSPHLTLRSECVAPLNLP